MSTVIAKNQFQEYDGKAKVAANNIYIEYQTSTETKREPITKFFVGKTGKHVKSYSEFKKNLDKNNIFIDATGVQSVKRFSTDVKVQVENFSVPDNFDSTRINKRNPRANEVVPYGLRRNLSVAVADASVDKAERYFFVEVAGKKDFYQANEIYFYDSANKKHYLSETAIDVNSLTDVQLFTDDGTKISNIYTEKQYVFPKLNARESVDYTKQEKTTYQITSKTDESGNKIIEPATTTKHVDKYFSEQKYVIREVDDDKKPGKTKEAKFIEVKNYRLDPSGEFISVILNNRTQMVKISDIVNVDGSIISSLNDMIGKEIGVKIGDQIVKTKPLTYEQANRMFSTIKTYQETESELSDKTYLMLKDGGYVKEMENVQPKSYRVVNSDATSFDAYLVKTTDADGNEKYEIVSKEYFAKHGDKTKYKLENAIKIQRCDYNSSECAIVQTTSQGKQIEQCQVVKKSRVVDEEAKRTAYEAFKAGYKEGQYKVSDVYVDGEQKELSARGKRYEKTDTTYLEDKADNSSEYSSLKSNDIRIENGKITGGPHFDIGLGIKNSYSSLGKFFGMGFTPVMLGAILTAPIGGPLFAAAFMAGSAIAVPAIPVVNLVKGAVTNAQKSRFADKAALNRKYLQKDLEKRIKNLYERQTSKDRIPLSEAMFNDVYDKLVNDIITLSSSSIANELRIVDGVGKVTPENANAAKDYIDRYKKVSSELKLAGISLKDAKLEFDELDKQMKHYEEEGYKVKEKFLKKYNKAKEKYETLKSRHNSLLAEQEALKNYSGNPSELEAHEDRDRLLNVAEMMKLSVYVKTFPESEIVKEALATLTEEEIAMLDTLKLDFRNGLFLDQIGLGTSDEEFVFTQAFDEKQRGMWKNVKPIELGPDDKLILNIKKEKGEITTSQHNYTNIEYGMREMVRLLSKESLTEDEEKQLKVLIAQLLECKDIIQEVQDNEFEKKETKNCSNAKEIAELSEAVLKELDKYAEYYEYQGKYKEQWLNVKNALRMIRDGITSKQVPQEPIPEEPAPHDATPPLEDDLNDNLNDDLEDNISATIGDINNSYGVKNPNKDGSIKMTKANFGLLLAKMKRCLELGKIVDEETRRLTPEEKREYQDLKFFINRNLKTIKSIINKQENGKNPKFVTSEVYDDFYTTRNDLLSVLDRTGIIVKADGTFYTQEDVENYAKDYLARKSKLNKQEEHESTSQEDAQAEYLAQLEALEREHATNQDKIQLLQGQQEREADKIKRIKPAFALLKTKQDALKSVEEKIARIKQEIKSSEAAMKKAKTSEEIQVMSDELSAKRDQATKLGDKKYDCESEVSVAKAQLDKMLKSYKLEGKSLDEIEQIFADKKAELDEIIANDRTIERQIALINSKLVEINNHTV